VKQITGDAFNPAKARPAGPGRLIIVDEADNLGNSTFNVIGQLHDATGCPAVLDGRPRLAALANIAALDGQQEAGALRHSVKVRELAITISSSEQITLRMLHQANTLLGGREWSRIADQLREAKAVG
jgi:DNA transposition AAA+ family ATPase